MGNFLTQAEHLINKIIEEAEGHKSCKESIIKGWEVFKILVIVSVVITLNKLLMNYCFLARNRNRSKESFF